MVPVDPSEDEVSEANEETVGLGTETTPNEAGTPEEWAEAIEKVMPGPESDGKPEQAEAVETSEAEEKPEVTEETPVVEAEAEKPDAETTKEPEETPEAPEAKQTINFEGFTDDQKTTLERLHADKHVTAEFIEETRKGYLRQSDYSKKTERLAREREALTEELTGWKKDYETLQTIRDDDRLHEQWIEFQKRMNRGEDTSTDLDGEDLVDAKTASEIARKAVAEDRKAESARVAESERVREGKLKVIGETVGDLMTELDLTYEAIKPYLLAEEAESPGDVAFEDYITPAALKKGVRLRHEAAVAKAEAAALKKKISKRTTKDIRTSKQSLPPAPRVARSGGLSLAEQLDEDYGSDWVQDIAGGS